MPYQTFMHQYHLYLLPPTSLYMYVLKVYNSKLHTILFNFSAVDCTTIYMSQKWILHTLCGHCIDNVANMWKAKYSSRRMFASKNFHVYILLQILPKNFHKKLVMYL